MSRFIKVSIAIATLAIGLAATSVSAWYFTGPHQNRAMVKLLNSAVDESNQNQFFRREQKVYGKRIITTLEKNFTPGRWSGDVNVWYYITDDDGTKSLVVQVRYSKAGLDGDTTMTYFINDYNLDGIPDPSSSIGPYFLPGRPGSAMLGTSGTITPAEGPAMFKGQYRWALLQLPGAKEILGEEE